MLKQKHSLIASLAALCLLSNAAYALPFSIAPKAGTSLPTQGTPGSTVTAYYTVTNNTVSARANNYVKYLPPNVSQITSGGTYGDTCGATFNLAAKSSCTLQLSISGAVNANDADPHHHLFVCFPGGITCAGTNYPLNVSYSSSSVVHPPSTAYITTSTTIVTCQVSATDGSLTNCQPTSNSIVTFSPIATAIDSTGTHLYATDGNASVYFCPINSSGSLTACQSTATGINGTWTIAVNPTSTFAYIINSGVSGQIVTYCPILGNGNFGTCNTTGNGFDNPVGVAVNAAGTYAYIPNSQDNTVSYCPVNGNGTFNTCTATSALFNVPDGIATTPSGDHIYVSNSGNNTVSYCSTDPSNGSVISCTPLSDSSFISPGAIAVNPTGSTAYIVNNSNSVVYCPINAVDGTFGTCNPVSGVSAAMQITVS